MEPNSSPLQGRWFCIRRIFESCSSPKPRSLGTQAEELKRIHLAGAFGNYVQAASAISIGLLEFSPQRIVPSGNTALRGAKMLLLSANQPALPRMEHVALAADADFQDEFVNCMNFPQIQQPA
jgi:uncharacterized 2Fe-2S/4Fe-4S cluster protein (DUF4445 family)